MAGRSPNDKSARDQTGSRDKPVDISDDNEDTNTAQAGRPERQNPAEFESRLRRALLRNGIEYISGNTSGAPYSTFDPSHASRPALDAGQGSTFLLPSSSGPAAPNAPPQLGPRQRGPTSPEREAARQRLVNMVWRNDVSNTRQTRPSDSNAPSEPFQVEQVSSVDKLRSSATPASGHPHQARDRQQNTAPEGPSEDGQLAEVDRPVANISIQAQHPQQHFAPIGIDRPSTAENAFAAARNAMLTLEDVDPAASRRLLAMSTEHTNVQLTASSLAMLLARYQTDLFNTHAALNARRTELDSLQAELAARNAQIAGYVEQLQGSISPDDAQRLVAEGQQARAERDQARNAQAQEARKCKALMAQHTTSKKKMEADLKQAEEERKEAEKARKEAEKAQEDAEKQLEEERSARLKTENELKRKREDTPEADQS